MKTSIFIILSLIFMNCPTSENGEHLFILNLMKYFQTSDFQDYQCNVYLEFGSLNGQPARSFSKYIYSYQCKTITCNFLQFQAIAFGIFLVVPSKIIKIVAMFVFVNVVNT